MPILGQPMVFLRLLIVGALITFSACSTLDTQSDFAAGRQAFLRNDPAAAASYFGRVAQSDPNTLSAPLSCVRVSGRM